ncbi:hypothetical protein J5N97_025880 [Dioscorea zingiberensis]|uniref:Uncharacterized protein n=1 Tax=Dioscorea zingiberensis TaxID=325984 RepID=A0A9D5H6D5_9LILI|nr:hypothetical protein J5N97_025880 [Dioscorea zingiberensis]
MASNLHLLHSRPPPFLSDLTLDLSLYHKPHPPSPSRRRHSLGRICLSFASFSPFSSSILVLCFPLEKCELFSYGDISLRIYHIQTDDKPLKMPPMEKPMMEKPSKPPVRLFHSIHADGETNEEEEEEEEEEEKEALGSSVRSNREVENIAVMEIIHKVEVPPPNSAMNKLKLRFKETFFPDDPFTKFKGQPLSSKCILAAQFLFPILLWPPNYSLSLFKSDLISGLTIASLAISRAK